MTSFFAPLVDFVHAHSQYTHIAIFLLALSEAIPVVGTVVPGSTLIIGISALATSANANPWLLVIAATAGAIIGDGLSFWLGQRYHREILSNRNWLPALIQINDVRYRTFIFILSRQSH
jgi:membrane protein DedA with SNARE-associated domain